MEQSSTTSETPRRHFTTGICEVCAFLWLFTIYMGKPVWVNRKQNLRLGKFRPGIALTICANQFHLRKTAAKQPANAETGIKDGFEEMEHQLPFGTFRPGKQELPEIFH